eukprot:12153950-Ditylum_brightwellii.AAC.1
MAQETPHEVKKEIAHGEAFLNSGKVFPSRNQMEELCLHVRKEMWKQQKNKIAAAVNDDGDDIEETSDDDKKKKEMPKA